MEGGREGGREGRTVQCNKKKIIKIYLHLNMTKSNKLVHQNRMRSNRDFVFEFKSVSVC